MSPLSTSPADALPATSAAKVVDGNPGLPLAWIPAAVNVRVTRRIERPPQLALSVFIQRKHPQELLPGTSIRWQEIDRATDAEKPEGGRRIGDLGVGFRSQSAFAVEQCSRVDNGNHDSDTTAVAGQNEALEDDRRPRLPAWPCGLGCRPTTPFGNSGKVPFFPTIDTFNDH